MPHSRPRLATELIRKRLTYFRVVSIQGARQTGKSFLAREFMGKAHPGSQYVSFDSMAVRRQASDSPDTFIEMHEASRPLIIDEAQKVPEIFDAVKLVVDEENRPGRFVLLGSTEFSREVQVRESLTGRLGRVRLHPLCLQELEGLSKPVLLKRAAFLNRVAHGGMPGIAFARSGEARGALIDDWAALICERDLALFKTLKLDRDLAHELIKLSCTLEEPTAAAFTRATRANPRTVLKHCGVLEQLFVLNRITPLEAGRGKPLYLVLDSGIAAHFGASLRRQLQVFLLNERLCLNSYAGAVRTTFHYYRSRKKHIIDVVEKPAEGKIKAHQIIETERFSGLDFELMKSLLKANPKSHCTIYAPVRQAEILHGIKLAPWESMAVAY